jgi:hypothetical protein
MRYGADAIGRSGIVEKHAYAISNMAQNRNLFILVRPVNGLSTSLIEAGYATKDMHVKGKSSDWGPQAGFICVNQAYSKLARKAAHQVPAFNMKVQQSISAGDARAVPLIIDRARLDELKAAQCFEYVSRDEQVIKVESTKDAPRQVFTLLSHSRMSAGQQVFYRRYANDFSVCAGMGLEDMWLVLDGDLSGDYLGAPVEVLANPRTGIPLTADYDLYAVCPVLDATSFGQMLGRSEQIHFPNLGGSPEERAAISIQRAFRQKQANARVRDVGRATQYLIKAVSYVNEACGRSDNPVCHHGGEVDNPNPESDWEITVFNPLSNARHRILRTDTKVELEQVASEIIAAGYLFYTNRAYADFDRPAMANLNQRFLTT